MDGVFFKNEEGWMFVGDVRPLWFYLLHVESGLMAIVKRWACRYSKSVSIPRDAEGSLIAS